MLRILEPSKVGQKMMSEAVSGNEGWGSGAFGQLIRIARTGNL